MLGSRTILDLPGETVIVGDILPGRSRGGEVSGLTPVRSPGEAGGLRESPCQIAASGDRPVLAAVARGQGLVQGRRERGGHPVVDRSGRGDHGGHARLEQSFDLRPRRTAVEEDQFQPALLPQERGEPLGEGRAQFERRLQEQAIAVGVAAEMEDRDPVAIGLKDGIDPLERGLFLDHEFVDQTTTFQFGELVLERPSLDFQ